MPSCHVLRPDSVGRGCDSTRVLLCRAMAPHTTPTPVLTPHMRAQSHKHTTTPFTPPSHRNTPHSLSLSCRSAPPVSHSQRAVQGLYLFRPDRTAPLCYSSLLLCEDLDAKLRASLSI